MEWLPAILDRVFVVHRTAFQVFNDKEGSKFPCKKDKKINWMWIKGPRIMFLVNWNRVEPSHNTNDENLMKGPTVPFSAIHHNLGMLDGAIEIC